MSDKVPHCLGAYLAKSAASDIEHIWQLSYRGGFYRGGPVLMSALAGIDIALWDIKGSSTSSILPRTNRRVG